MMAPRQWGSSGMGWSPVFNGRASGVPEAPKVLCGSSEETGASKSSVVRLCFFSAAALLGVGTGRSFEVGRMGESGAKNSRGRAPQSQPTAGVEHH